MGGGVKLLYIYPKPVNTEYLMAQTAKSDGDKNNIINIAPATAQLKKEHTQLGKKISKYQHRMEYSVKIVIVFHICSIACVIICIVILIINNGKIHNLENYIFELRQLLNK